MGASQTLSSHPFRKDVVNSGVICSWLQLRQLLPLIKPCQTLLLFTNAIFPVQWELCLDKATGLKKTPITLCYSSFPSLSRSTRFFRVKHHPFHEAVPEFPDPIVSPFLNSCGMNDNENDPLMSSVTASLMCQLDLTKSRPGSWKTTACGYVC